MGKIEVRFEAWMRQAFELYKNNFVLLLLVHLAAVAMSWFTLGVLAGPLMAGAALVTLALLDGRDPPPQAGDLFKGLAWFLPAFLLFLVIGAANVIVWAVFFWLPPLAAAASLLLQTATVFALFLVIERRMDFASAIRGSFDIVRTNFWPMLGLVAIGSVVAGAGAVVCAIGVVVTLPFYTCLTAIAWRAVSGQPAAGADRIALSASPQF